MKLVVPERWVHDTTISRSRIKNVVYGQAVRTCDHIFGTRCRCPRTERLVEVEILPYLEIE